MAGKVFPSIETGNDPLSADGSVLSDDTYVEKEGTPEPDDPEARLSWGRKRYGEDWYLERVAGREAAQEARYKEEERERIEDEKLEEIRQLRETDPWEYRRRMREYNLGLQGLTKEQIDRSNRPLPKAEIKRNWEGFTALLQGKVLQLATTDGRADARSESMEVSQPRTSLRLQKSTKKVPHKRHSRIAKSTARDGTVSNGNRSKRPAPTLAGALVDEKSASNATNVKIFQSKHDKTSQRGERASRRLANKPVEYGIFANTPILEDLQRNPSTRKRNLAGPPSKEKSIAVEPAKHRGALKSGREGTHRSRSKKQSGG